MLVDNAAKTGLTAFASALNIVNITKAFTTFVAISPIRPLNGSIKVPVSYTHLTLPTICSV